MCSSDLLRACPADVADIARHAGQPVIVGRHEGRSSKAARGAMVAVLPGGSGDHRPTGRGAGIRTVRAVGGGRLGDVLTWVDAARAGRTLAVGAAVSAVICWCDVRSNWCAGRNIQLVTALSNAQQKTAALKHLLHREIRSSWRVSAP